jgi:hypothetical protein
MRDDAGKEIEGPEALCGCGHELGQHVESEENLDQPCYAPLCGCVSFHWPEENFDTHEG